MSVSASSSAAVMGWNSLDYTGTVHPCKACAAAYLLATATEKYIYAYMRIPCMLVFMGYLVVGLLL
jgi:hypothetical protein